MANIVQMKDSANAVFYPQTHEKAVIDSNGVNLQTKLQSITTPTYVTAWDGASTPVVANIPAGVTVTYNTTSYTGTLAASASTANKTYLVSTGTTDNYNRYVTQLNGSTYSWQNIGSTEIDLSDYATLEELNQLDQELNDNFTSGYYLDKNGNQVADATMGYSDFVAYTGGSVNYRWDDAYANITGPAIVFYNENKERIDYFGLSSASAANDGRTLSASQINANTRYFRLSYVLGTSAHIKFDNVTAWEPKAGLKTKVAQNTANIEKTASDALFDIAPFALQRTGYIDYSTGELVGSTAVNIWQFPNLGYKRITITTANNTNVPAAVAFYNGRVGYAETFISGIQTAIGTHEYIITNIPDECVAIVVSCNVSLLAMPKILVSAGSYANSAITVNNNINPLKGKPFICHYKPANFIADGDGVKVYPGESIGTIAMAARLGFGFIEANIQVTADNQYVVIHGGTNATFGDEVETTNSDNIENVAISSKTLAYIQEYVRYKYVPSKYNKVATLEEFVAACKVNHIGIFARTSEFAPIQYCLRILGQTGVIIDTTLPYTRTICPGSLFIHWHADATLTATDLLAEARRYGKPYACMMDIGLISALNTAETLDGFISSMHKEGFLVGASSTYLTEEQMRNVLAKGFDIFTVGHEINPFTPNYECYDLNGPASQFGGTGSISDNIATLANGQTLACGNAAVIPLGKGEISLRFAGSIAVNFGSVGSRSVISDGNEDVIISDYFLRNSTELVITATADTSIYSLVYKTSRC